jgi:hypothetical protein
MFLSNKPSSIIPCKNETFSSSQMRIAKPETEKPVEIELCIYKKTTVRGYS